MKLFVKLMLAILVIGLLLPFTLLKDENGKTMLNFSDLKLPGFSMPEFSMPELPDLGSSMTSAKQADDLQGKDVFYKWYDADGNVQFTTEQPPAGIEFSVKGFDPNTNVIQAVKVEAKTSGQDEQGDETAPKSKAAKSSDIENPYSREKIEKLFEDAEGLEKLLNERMQKQNSAIQ